MLSPVFAGIFSSKTLYFLKRPRFFSKKNAVFGFLRLN